MVMRNNRMYEVVKRLNDINKQWDERKVEDATATDEWDEYESLLYALCEFVVRG